MILSFRLPIRLLFFFFNDTATTEIYTLSLHDALPISRRLAPSSRLFRSLSEKPRSTAANDPGPSAAFSARKKPQRIAVDTPPVFFGPAALHPATAPSPRYEGILRQAPWVCTCRWTNWDATQASLWSRRL